jgi:hypothetical protein
VTIRRLDVAVSAGPVGLEVCITGTAEALASLSSLVRSGGVESLGRSRQRASPRPYDRWLETIEVRTTESLVRVMAEGATLVLEGDHPSRGLLAGNLHRFAGGRSEEEHLHIEWYEGHRFVEAGSLSLVVEKMSCEGGLAAGSKP